MAEKISEEQLKPLAQRVADEAEPRTKEATQQYLRDPAKQVAEQVTVQGILPTSSALSVAHADAGWLSDGLLQQQCMVCNFFSALSPCTACDLHCVLYSSCRQSQWLTS